MHAVNTMVSLVLNGALLVISTVTVVVPVCSSIVLGTTDKLQNGGICASDISTRKKNAALRNASPHAVTAALTERFGAFDMIARFCFERFGFCLYVGCFRISPTAFRRGREDMLSRGVVVYCLPAT